MRSKLSFFDQSGRHLESVAANAQQNSLRHIAETTDGGVAVGYQWQGDPYDAPPLIGVVRGSTMISFEDTTASYGLEAYVGSVAAHPKGIAVTSPRGGKLVLFSSDGVPLLVEFSTDICGLTVSDGDVIATDGFGRVFRLRDSVIRLEMHSLLFDNHLISVAV